MKKGRGGAGTAEMIVESVGDGPMQTPRDKMGKPGYMANVISPDSGASSGERAPRKPPSGKKRPSNVKSRTLDFDDKAANNALTRAKGQGIAMKTNFGSTKQGLDPPAPRGLPISSKRSSPRRTEYASIASPGMNVISPASSTGGEADAGYGVVYNSPDPTSKFHNTQGQNDFGNDDSNTRAQMTPSSSSNMVAGFSPMPATPTEHQLIIDLEKKMADAMEGPRVLDSHEAPGPYEGGLESPDVLSKFSTTATLRGGLPQKISCESPTAASHDNDVSGHDFSPMPATPSTPHGGGMLLSKGASDYSNAPIIYGNGVALISPDVLSKFNASGRPVAMEPVTPTAPAGADREHDFSPMPDTPSTPAAAMLKPASPGKRGMPLIIGQGVSIESPDVLSKFSASGRPLMMNVVTPDGKSTEREHDFSPMPDTPVTPGAHTRLERLGGALPQASAMPTIYGQGVTVESPDLLSKFNSQKRAISFMSPVEEGPSEHDFSPMPATPTEYLPKHAPPVQAPIIYGNGVEVDSPDVLSKFNHTAPVEPEAKTNAVVESAKIEAARSTVPVVHRKRFLRNQSYVSTSLDSGSACAARPPASLRSSRQQSTVTTQQPKEPVMDLFSETLSPLKENYGNLLQSIQGEIRQGSYESPRKSIGTPKSKASPLVKVGASPAPGVSTFAATVHTRRTPKSRTPPRAKAVQLDPFADTLSPYKDDYNELRDKVNSAATPKREEKPDIFADTLSPFKDDYTEIRERVNEMVKREELAAQTAASAPSFDYGAIKKPAPPPPRRKQAFSSASSPIKPHGPSSSPTAARGGRTFSPTNAAAGGEGGDLQILSFETSTHSGDNETPPRQFEQGASQFRRRGRILRESASEPLIRTVPMVSQSPSLKPAATCSSPKHEEEEDEILSAINRFEHSYEDDYELKPMTLLNESDQADRFPSEKAHEQEDVIDDEMTLRVKVTFVGSNLREGESLKKEKKRKRPLFGPFQPNLESLPEDAESVLCFPSWITPVPRFMKKAFPMQSVQVKVSSSVIHDNSQDSPDVDSLLGSQELKLVGRIRRRPTRKTEGGDSPDSVGEAKEETPLFRDDTYGNWMRDQSTVHVRDHNDGDSQQFDDLFRAIEKKNNGLLKELTREGFSLLDPECRDSIGNTPLMAACSSNNRKIVKLLLKHGCDFDAVNKHGNTALHFAAEYQLSSTTKYLLKKGASRTIRNSFGMAAGDRVEAQN